MPGSCACLVRPAVRIKQAVLHCCTCEALWFPARADVSDVREHRSVCVLKPRFSSAILVAIICHLRLSPYGPSQEPRAALLIFGSWSSPSLRSFSSFRSWKLRAHRVCSRCLLLAVAIRECLLEARRWRTAKSFVYNVCLSGQKELRTTSGGIWAADLLVGAS